MPTLSEIKKDVYKVNQLRGCCGFAATLMALLVRKSKVVDELVQCVANGRKFRDIDQSVRVKGRIEKRLKVGIIDSRGRHDFQLILALMILFKEYSKQNNLGAWEECIEYSQKWNGWNYAGLHFDHVDDSLYRWAFGGPKGSGFFSGTYSQVTPRVVSKIKDVEQGKTIGNGLTLGLSYKRGDFAVPGPLMATLLGMVGLTVFREGPLIETSGFRQFTRLATVQDKVSVVRPKYQILQSLMWKVQQAGSASAYNFSDAIVGVGNRPNQSDFEAYHNVTHWVYVPAKPKNKPGANEFKCWTWGGEYDFWQFMVNVKKYYPAYVIYLD